MQMMGASEILLLLSGVLVVIYFCIKRKYNFWERTNVPYIKATSIFGNLKEMFFLETSTADHMSHLYHSKEAQDQPAIGINVFYKPALLIRDPELIKSILIKDFNKFSNRFTSCDPHGDPLGHNNLFFIKNPQWKELRTKLTPVFTSGKLKQMFPLINEIGNELDSYISNRLMDSNTKSCVKEVKDICALYTTDVIASVAFGLKANSLENPNCDFRKNGKPIFKFTTYRAFEFLVVFFLPQFIKVLKCKIFPKDATAFIRDTINYAMTERMKTGNTRNDLIDILVGFQKELLTNKDQRYSVRDSLEVNNDVLVAQAAVFFTAGFETSSSSMSFGLYELSKKPELQTRLRAEIREAFKKGDGKITFDILNEMEYLNMVFQEILRLYPPLPLLDRECTLAGDEKEYSLKPYIDFGIPHGMPVYVPSYAIQRDPKYFPNPDKFDPERFAPENKANVLSGSYMPFGIGPHNCIGERFGLIQAKVGLINFLRNHYVTTCEKTLKNMVLDPNALIIQPKGGIYCQIVKDPL